MPETARGPVLRSTDRRLLLVVADGAAATLAVVAALWTWSITAGFTLTPGTLAAHARWLAAVPVWVVALSATRHPRAAFDVARTRQGLLQAAGVLLVAYMAAYFYTGDSTLPRLVVVYLLWNALWFTAAVRAIAAWTLTRSGFARRLALVGGDHADRRVFDALLAEPALADAVDVTDPAEATDVVLAGVRELDRDGLDRLIRWREGGARVTTLADLEEDSRHRVPLGRVGLDWVLFRLVAGGKAQEASALLIRWVDVGVALLLLVVGVVPMLVAAVATVFDTGWPVLYHQARVGQSGRTFRLTKLRTMVVGAEADGAQWSPAGDPRVTRVGRMLRRTHLDELPNLWAVIRGDLSLVGPRPERPEFTAALEQQIPLYRARLAVKPGLTGWAQVHEEYADSVEDSVRKLEYDLYYVRHQSLALNARVLLLTAGRMLGWKGR